MSRLIMGISGALALSLLSGAAELARGRDLSPIAGGHTPIIQPLSLSPALSDEGAPMVNRGSKADRTAGPTGSPASTRTVSLRFDGFSDTSFLVRFPVAVANPPVTSAPGKPLLRRPMVACEPVVSILTDVAKRLPPGRCIA
jgi:hypothetical protein